MKLILSYAALALLIAGPAKAADGFFEGFNRARESASRARESDSRREYLDAQTKWLREHSADQCPNGIRSATTPNGEQVVVCR